MDTRHKILTKQIKTKQNQTTYLFVFVSFVKWLASVRKKYTHCCVHDPTQIILYSTSEVFYVVCHVCVNVLVTLMTKLMSIGEFYFSAAVPLHSCLWASRISFCKSGNKSIYVFSSIIIVTEGFIYTLMCSMIMFTFYNIRNI